MADGKDKTWDFPASAEDGRRARAREADLHISLTDDHRYAKQHEALQRVASLLVSAVDDAVERMHAQARKDGDEPDEDVAAVYEDEREYHVRRIAAVLLNEALDSWARKR